jgi:hypothetical protein
MEVLHNLMTVLNSTAKRQTVKITYYYYYLFHIPLDPNTNTGLQPLDMERVNEKIHYIQS